MTDKFIQVIDNIKQITGIKTDIELAKQLGIKQPNFAERKKKGSIPYKEIVNFCLREGISLSGVFSEKNSSADEIKTLNLELLQEIIEVVEQQIKDLDLSLDAKKKAEIIDYIYIEMLSGKKENLGKIANKLITLAA